MGYRAKADVNVNPLFYDTTLTVERALWEPLGQMARAGRARHYDVVRYLVYQWLRKHGAAKENPVLEAQFKGIEEQMDEGIRRHIWQGRISEDPRKFKVKREVEIIEEEDDDVDGDD